MPVEHKLDVCDLEGCFIADLDGVRVAVKVEVLLFLILSSLSLCGDVGGVGGNVNVVNGVVYSCRWCCSCCRLLLRMLPMFTGWFVVTVDSCCWMMLLWLVLLMIWSLGTAVATGVVGVGACSCCCCCYCLLVLVIFFLLLLPGATAFVGFCELDVVLLLLCVADVPMVGVGERVVVAAVVATVDELPEILFLHLFGKAS